MPNPKPNKTERSELLNVRLPTDVMAQLRAIRERQGTPMAQMVVRAVRLWLEAQDGRALIVELKGGAVTAREFNDEVAGMDAEAIRRQATAAPPSPKGQPRSTRRRSK